MKFRPTLLAIGFAAFAACMTTTVSAEGNVANGKVRAYTCQGCHGIANYKNAFPSYSVPKLGGQSPKYIESALKAYASGERAHPTMHSHAVTMTDQDRQDLASFLHGEKVQPSDQVVGTPPPATQTCVACHGADGARTVAEDYPILAGQKADYLVQALKDYKSGKRKNAVMSGIVGAIKESDFEEIALFFSKQAGLCTTDKVAKQGKCDAR